jgi:ATP-binding cassette subfamily B protein
MDFSKKLTYPRTLAIPFRVAPWESAAQMLSNIISLAISPVSVLVAAYFIDTALAVFGEGLPWQRIVPPIIALAAFNVYGYLLNPLLGLISTKRSVKARLALRVPFLEKRVRLEYKHVENSETMDLIARAWDNPEGRLNGMLDTLAWFVLLVGQTASYIIILMVHAPVPALIMVGLGVPVLYIAAKGGQQQYQAERDMTKRDRRFWLLNWLMRARETAHERNLFGYTPWLNRRYRQEYEKSRKHKLKVEIKWYARSKSSAVVLGLLSSVALFLMIPSVLSGDLTVGLYISLLGALFACINMMGWGLPNTFQQFAEQREYLKDANLYFALSEATDAHVLPAIPPPDFDRLVLKDVSFTYPGTDKLILDKVSLTIESGRHYAFVGKNGAGKTTLTKLMTRLYNDFAGEIWLNDKPLGDHPAADIKATFCALFQDFCSYDITLAQNIELGKINGASEAETDRAIQLAGLTDKVSELKDGKHTLLGKTHEDGLELSGGEWQRVAFARAILSPAPVKILDEPTAALDPVAESEVYKQFEEISRGITTLFISHRLASAKMADVIFVLDEGKIVEQGSHAELMQAGGLYAEMFESQRGWYV